MPPTFSFGAFEANLRSGELHKHGTRIRLREKSFQALAMLLEHPGEVVTRDELRHRLWPEDVHVDFENNLNTAIARLRQALGDSADRPRFIETLPKHGYRFLPRVSERAPSPARQPAPVRLVVLPFVNQSGDPGQEYFSDAMTDEIITALAVLAPDRLAVIARTTAMYYKDRREDVARIGRDLHVEYVVEGGAHRAGDRIALNVQLIRVSDQTHTFAGRYEAAADQLFGLQREASRAIARQLGVAPGEDAADRQLRRPTRDLAAYHEYIQGRHELSGGAPDALARARQHFESAIARDPDFALAFDSLAEMFWYLGYIGFMPPTEAFSTGVRYALRALAIDDTLAETHALLGLYHKQLDYNWPEVEREMARALALDPDSPIVRVRYAFHALMPQARLEEAVGQLERALDRDPLSGFIRSHLAIVLLFCRRFGLAEAEAQRILELDRKAFTAYLVLGVCLRVQGRFEDAVAAHRKAVELSGGSPAMVGWLGHALAAGGNRDEARGLLDRLHAKAATGYIPPTSLALIHLGLGELDRAFEWLERAIDAHDQLMMPIKSYSVFDPIRSDRRYCRLLRKMNLDP